MSKRTISDDELAAILMDRFNKRETRKQEHFDSLPKWVPRRMKENALTQFNILSEQFSKDQIIKFVEDYPDLSVPDSVNGHGGLGTYGFYYMVGELFIFDCGVKAGEEKGRKILQGDSKTYLFRKAPAGWMLGDIYAPKFIKTKRQGFDFMKFLIEHPSEKYLPLVLDNAIHGYNMCEESLPSKNNMPDDYDRPDKHEAYDNENLKSLDEDLTIKTTDSFIEPTDSEMKAVREYREKIADLEDELTSPLTDEDKDKVRGEIDKYEEAINGIMDPYTGGAKKIIDGGERLRVNIATQIGEAIKLLPNDGEKLRDFLDKRIVRSNKFSYQPYPGDPDWVFHSK